MRKPDAIFVFVPSGQGGTFMKQFVERGLDKAGIKLIGPGDVTDDDLLPGMGDAVIGTVTAHLYSAAHPSQMNKDFVAAFEKANNFRPNFMAVGGYDGMHLIYEALKKTGGKADGDSLVARDEGHAVGEPARPDLDRSGDARHRPEHLHPQGREGERPALQHRVRDLRSGQGSGETEEIVRRHCYSHVRLLRRASDLGLWHEVDVVLRRGKGDPPTREPANIRLCRACRPRRPTWSLHAGARC